MEKENGSRASRERERRVAGRERTGGWEGGTPSRGGEGPLRTERERSENGARAERERSESRPQRADAGSTGSPLWQNESFMPRALAFTASSGTGSPFLFQPGPDGERLTRASSILHGGTEPARDVCRAREHRSWTRGAHSSRVLGIRES